VSTGAVSTGAVLTHGQVLQDPTWDFAAKFIKGQFFEVGDVDPSYFDYVEDETTPGLHEG
jgi:hypothetical protein